MPTRSFPLLIGSLVGAWLGDTCPEAVREGVFESWCPGTARLTEAIMAKRQNHSQTFYLDCFQREERCSICDAFGRAESPVVLSLAS